MANSIGPNAQDRIAGKNPTTVLAAGTHTSKKFYAIQLASGTSISSCTGTDPNGEAVDFVATYNWDAATDAGLLVAGENYVITAITTSGGIAFAY